MPRPSCVDQLVIDVQIVDSKQFVLFIAILTTGDKVNSSVAGTVFNLRCFQTSNLKVDWFKQSKHTQGWSHIYLDIILGDQIGIRL